MLINWHRTDEMLPEEGERVLCYSPAYENKDNDAMLYRVMSSEFVKICSEVSHWAYLQKPNTMKDEDYLP